MQFLKTLFWVALAVLVVLFSTANWSAVPVRLWGGLIVDIKLPVLIGGAFLLGLLPMFALHKARVWSLRRRLDTYERQVVTAPVPVVPAPVEPEPPLTPEPPSETDRIATDSKVWPAQ